MSDRDPTTRSVLAWAKDKGVDEFFLAGAAVLAGWPRGNVYDERAPLLVTESDFDKAVAAFRGLEMKLCPSPV
jgi:hypothetical protein